MAAAAARVSLTADSTRFLEETFPLKTQQALRNQIRGVIYIAKYIATLHGEIAELHKLQKENWYSNPNSGTRKTVKKKQNVITGAGAGGAVVGGEPLLTVTDISFSIPQRKKFTLEVTAEGVLAVTNGAEGRKVEWCVRWRDIKTTILLPVPEKAARQFNFCIFPHNSEGIDTTTTTADPSPEPCVFTLPDTPPKTASGPYLTTPALDPTHTQTYTSLLTALFNAHLRTPIATPSKSEFVSAIPQPHRKGEAAFHVKAHRGSKDGYLWFLPEGILWGFKKPLAYFEFVRIESVSYTSITKRTFNLNIHVHTHVPGAGGGDNNNNNSKNSSKDQEVEFAMIDQADYAGIDMYVRKHRLNDKSMAEMRRAVRYNVNKAEEGEDGVEGGAGAGEGGGGGGGGAGATISDLQKALEDAEDEEEEDYDPEEDGGSSDGSGGSSDDDDDDDDDGDSGDDDEDDGSDAGSINLEDELGSGLEEVAAASDEEMGGVAKKIAARRRRAE
ncbi:hypothetical protein DFH27DRAFT_592895 [Peziza echinospora]|nr:hypothetical protein DFH27DRAFT_592895 [Peziza echinospora]